jgi:hypothetical protein
MQDLFCILKNYKREPNLLCSAERTLKTEP